MTATGGPFSMFPTRRGRSTRFDFAAFADAVVAWALVAVAGAVRARSITEDPRPAVIALIGTAVALVVVLSRRRSAWAIATIAASAVSAMAGGRTVGATVFVGSVLAIWVVGMRRSDPDGRVPDPACRGPLLGVVVAASVAGRPQFASWQPIAVLLAGGGAVAALATARPSWVQAIEHGVSAGAARVGRLVAGLLLGAVGIVVVVVPWCVHRTVGWDPTWVRHRPRTRWIPRVHAVERPRSSWGAENVDTGGRRLRRAALRLEVAVLVVAALIASVLWATRPAQVDRSGAEAMAASPWWPDAERVSDEIYERARFSAFVGPVLPDVRSDYVNVVDGRRRTWRAPACTCRRLRIWMFGGSTTFGIGQRDGHTVASELARSAAHDGIILDIVNFGVHGDVLWNEGRRLEAALGAGDEPPDLIVFYDGFNDLRTVQLFDDEGGVADGPFIGALDPDFLPAIATQRRLLDRLVRVMDTSSVTLLPRDGRRLTPDEEVTFAARQYRLGMESVQRLVDDAHIPTVFFYQPTRASLNPPRSPEDEAPQSRATERAFRAALPDGVVDLSGVLDGRREALYLDGVHTNELGAALVARSMLDSLRPRLVDLGASPR